MCETFKDIVFKMKKGQTPMKFTASQPSVMVAFSTLNLGWQRPQPFIIAYLYIIIVEKKIGLHHLVSQNKSGNNHLDSEIDYENWF